MADQYNKILTTVNSVTSNYSFTPDLSNVIVIDTSNNRIGINTANPEFSIDICNGRIRTRFLEITEPSYGFIYEGTTAFGTGAIENLQVIYSATFESSCVVNIDNSATDDGDQFVIAWTESSARTKAGVWMAVGEQGDNKAYYRSIDGAVNWSEILLSGITGHTGNRITALAGDGYGNWMMGQDERIYYSTNNKTFIVIFQ